MIICKSVTEVPGSRTVFYFLFFFQVLIFHFFLLVHSPKTLTIEEFHGKEFIKIKRYKGVALEARERRAL